jgi:hypothetical protein
MLFFPPLSAFDFFLDFSPAASPGAKPVHSMRRGNRGQPKTLCRRGLEFICLRFANVDPESFFDGAEFSKIILCLTKAQRVVRSPSNLIGIMFVLPVIFPKANPANFVITAVSRSVLNLQQGHL